MKRIALCGSMKTKDDLIKAGEELERRGIRVLLPIECLYNEPKIIASRAHFTRIIDEDTEAILVVNSPKNNIPNYIGANTFAEIAFAFYYHKKIYLLNDIYEPYKEELEGWGAISLHNNLNNLK